MRWAAIVLAAASSAAAQQFSADQIVHHADGSESRAKLYVSHPKIRVETPAQGGRPAAVLIVDLAKQHTWTLLPASKKYVEASGAEAMKPLAFFAPKDGKPCDPSAPKPGAACRQLGPETFLGRATDKWESTTTVNGKPASVRLWIDAQLHYALKWDSNPAGGELQNLREGPQAASLFTLPKGYEDLKMPERRAPSP
jgi:hypothetical protein